MSKIQFESDSQLIGTGYHHTGAVGNMSKIQFESDSQRQHGVRTVIHGCWQYVKDTI